MQPATNLKSRVPQPENQGATSNHPEKQGAPSNHPEKQGKYLQNVWFVKLRIFEKSKALKTMAAPRGNTFWKIRAKHGRDALFTDPALLQEEANNYFEWCDKNPLLEQDFRGKDAIEVTIKKKRVYTLQGLCLYLNANTEYWRSFRSSQIAKSLDFSSVIRNIEETIYNQKFTGAASGFFNSNIIARDLGLADKQETKHELTPANAQIDYSKLSQSALDEIANATITDSLDSPADGFNKPIPIDQPRPVTPETDGSDLI